MAPPATPSPSAAPRAGTPGGTGDTHPTDRAEVPDRTVDTDVPDRPRRELSDRALVAITAAVTLPVAWMGYGTDIDVTDVLASAETIREGDYIPSRPPGVPVFEAIVAVLDPVGGHLLVNLATALAGAALVVATARLVRAWGRPNGDLVALALLASPLTLISATSTADFVWAAAFLVVGTLALVRGRPVPAGVLFALAMGCRLSSALLIAAVLAAIACAPAHRRRAVQAAAVAAPLTVVLYVPAWFAYGGTSTMFETAEGWRSFANNLGRFAYKDYAAFGLAFLVVLAVAAPALVRALRRWSDDPMLRTAVLCLAVSQAVFFVLPWKYNHLLPSVLAVLLWLAASDRNRRGFLWITVGAIALNGLVTFRPLSPDNPAQAETGRWDPALSPGLVANDIRCRSEAMQHDPLPLNRGAWACTLEPLRGEMVDAVDAESQLSLRERYG